MAPDKMSDSELTGNLPNLLADIPTAVREEFLADVREITTVSKATGLKLGEHLRSMRDELKATKRWYRVVKELAKVTGYADRTILRWVDGDENPQKKPAKPEFQKQREIRSLANRLESNHSLDAEAVADFASLAMQLTISEGPAGDVEAISFLTGVIESVAALRRMSVTVEIKVVA
ncbi:MAG: hypothetical protein PW792_08175 [Acidobacteriaceae bacterium]|nr:hypothetical protein [Acidobacteriaceae bacterium]